MRWDDKVRHVSGIFQCYPIKGISVSEEFKLFKLAASCAGN
jgi:hypothetical protein